MNQDTPKTRKSEYEVRLERMNALKLAGINPYPSKFDKQNIISEICSEEDGKKLKTAGRVMTIRKMGKIVFAHIQDQSGKAQIAVRSDVVGDEKFKFFVEFFDMGDFIGCSGEVFTTKVGEKTLLVDEFQMISKTLLPMPDKWHGLKDEEEKLRKRYLEILSDDDLRELFLKKARFWNSMREFLIKKGFVEVETPVLETTTGGADAKPFVTHHNALDIDVYLRISMGELWQKRLMVAGYDKTFEIGRQFRNEGMDAEHLQDYTQMEYYFGYADWNDGMALTEDLIKYTAQETFGTLKFNIKGTEVDLDKKWKTYDYRETILKNTKVDIEKTSVEEIKDKLQDLKVNYDDFDNLERGIDQLWKYCRRQIVGPGYLIYPPKIISPLAKESPERPGYTERYQLILAGSELCNGYSELNDPIDQEERFQHQGKLREEGDDEAQMHDADFVEALKHGMPPTTGLGISERLFSFLADRTIRECQIFPLVKPKGVMASVKPQEDADLGLEYDQAMKLVDKYIIDNKTKDHMRESEVVLRALARRLGADEEKWGIIGLLHDIDWDLTKDKTEEHTIKMVEILKATGASDFLINTIQSHAYGQGWEGDFYGAPELKDKKRTTALEHCLAAGETITGLIYAVGLMQPDKKLSSVKLPSLKKKVKNEKFAANCNRDLIRECEKAGIELDEFLEISLKAMQEIADEIGL